MPEKVYDARFLCTRDSARGILAEAILNRLGTARLRAQSAGSHPKRQVQPRALDTLRVCRELDRRIELFTNLNITSRDRASLEARLGEMGKGNAPRTERV